MDVVERFEAQLAALRGLPFVEDASLAAGRVVEPGARAWDACLTLQTPLGRTELWVEEKRSVAPRVAETLDELARRVPPRDWILFCREISPASAHRLAALGVNYVDAAGNCRVALGRHYIAHIEGRTAEPRAPLPRGRPGRTEYVLLLLFLSRSETLNLKLRELGELTGLSQTTLSYGLKALTKRGVLLDTRHQRALRHTSAIDRWIVGYADALRPSLMAGRFAYEEKDPLAFEVRAEQVLTTENIPFAWTGGTAAYRLQRYWHGEASTLYVDEPTTRLASLLRLIPRKDGPLEILRSPAPFVLRSGAAPHVAPLPLVYAELLADDDERARDAARRLREELLPEWPR